VGDPSGSEETYGGGYVNGKEGRKVKCRWPKREERWWEVTKQWERERRKK